MSIRQYIGARYVPKYMGHFDSTMEYEPLSIVDDANGNSYTSKIPVPAGTTLSDTKYWAQTGNFSGAVLQLQNRMTSAETNISTLQGDVSGLKDDVTGLQSDVTGLQSDVTGLQGDVSGMQGDVSDLKTSVPEIRSDLTDVIEELKAITDLNGKQILIVGDSVGDTGIADLQPNYVVSLSAKLAQFGATVTNNSVGGRFISTDETNNIVNAVQSIAGQYDIIILYVGVNDFAFQKSFTGIAAGFTGFNAWYKENMPNAKVYFVTPLSSETTTDKTPLLFYRAYYMYIAESLGYSIIDLFSGVKGYVGNNANDRSRCTRNADGVHPLPSFAPNVAEKIFKGLLSDGTQLQGNFRSGQSSGVLTFNGTPVAAYCDGNGQIQLMGGYTAQWTPTQAQTLIGTIPEWCRPYIDVTFETAGKVTFAIKGDGRVFAIVPAANQVYYDTAINVQYVSALLNRVNR